MATTIVAVDGEELEIPTCMIEDVSYSLLHAVVCFNWKIILPFSRCTDLYSEGDLLRNFEPGHMESRDQGGGQAKSRAATAKDRSTES